MKPRWWVDWQLNIFKRTIQEHPDWVRFAESVEDYFADELPKAEAEIQAGRSAKDLLAVIEDASDWGYEYGST